MVILNSKTKEFNEENGSILLNKQQIEAVEHEGSLLLTAPPGSGKSAVLVARVNHLITARNIRASNILAITFTRKAAEELKERVHNMPGVALMDLYGLNICTIHSLCLRILKASGFRRQILASDNKKDALMYSILKQHDLHDDYTPEQLLLKLSYLKNLGMELEELKPESIREKELLLVFKEYEQQNFEKSLWDFDDLLLACRELLQNQPDRREMLQKQLQFILVDEAQDLNPVQLDIIKLLFYPKKSELFLIADPNQSIYSFRAAAPGYLYNIEKYFPDIKTKNLTINYRNPGPVVDLAKNISKEPVNMTPFQNKGQLPVLLRPNDPADEAKVITRLIKEKHSKGKYLSKTCVLSRTSEHLLLAFEELIKQDIPCQIASSRCLIYEKPFVKPLLDNLNLTLDPGNKQAFCGMLKTMYIKKSLADKTVENASAKSSLLEELSKLAKLEKRQQKAVNERLELLNRIKELAPGEAIKTCRESFYDRYLENGYQYLLSPGREKALEKLDELEKRADCFETLEEYLTFVNRMIKCYKEEEIKEKQVLLMTIHGAKGLEFENVFIVGASETILPHQNAIEGEEASNWFQIQAKEDPLQEEARLLYVAITRSIKNLYISSPKTLKDKPVEVSRFVVNTNLTRGDGME